MRDKPDYCFTSNCPQATRGRGFSLGCGPVGAPISIMFERPAEDELAFSLKGPLPPGCSVETAKHIVKWREEEIARRKRDYPDLEDRFIIRGAPVRGMSGAELSTWVLPAVGGLKLDDCFLENVLKCAAPNDEEMYPTGEEKIAAEACCAHWNRLIPATGIDVSICSLHPAALLKDEGGGIVALPLQIDSFKKARSFMKAGKRVLILAGGSASKFWLGYAQTVTKWIGHWADETEATWRHRMERIADGLKLVANGPLEKKKKGKGKGKKPVDSTQEPSTPGSTDPTLSPSQSSKKKSRKPRKKPAPSFAGVEEMIP